MKKIYIIYIIIAIVVLVFTHTAYAQGDEPDDIKEIIDQTVDGLDMTQVNQMIEDINEKAQGYMPEISFRGFLDSILSGKEYIGFKDIFMGFIKYIFKEVSGNLFFLGEILILGVIAAILKNMHSAFNSKSINNIASMAVYVLMTVIVVQNLNMALGVGKEAIAQMTNFMQAMLPALITVMASMGSLTGAALFKPVVIGSVEIISQIIMEVVMPLIIMMAIIYLMNSINEKIQISYLAKLIQKVAIVLVGLCFTIFVGIATIEGVTSSSVDNLTVTTVKFAAGSFIPIIGHVLTDTLDVMFSSSLVINSALRMISIIALFVIISIPVAKIIVLILLYKFTAAVVQPIVDKKLSDALDGIGDSLTILLTAVICVGVMFYISLTILIGASHPGV
ncbi:MAG: stage III sporulation protein AE [Thermoanaerobacteraceae bacterium]|nr:stage III sporulation protein AE [Thermoanaerobacteraceae bacterium]